MLKKNLNEYKTILFVFQAVRLDDFVKGGHPSQDIRFVCRIYSYLFDHSTIDYFILKI